MVWLVGMADADPTQGQNSKKKKRKKPDNSDETGMSYIVELLYRPRRKMWHRFCAQSINYIKQLFMFSNHFVELYHPVKQNDKTIFPLPKIYTVKIPYFIYQYYDRHVCQTITVLLL